MTSPWAGASNPQAGSQATLNLPNWSVPVVDTQGKLTKPWRQYFEANFYRVGGTDGASSSDLVMSLPEDAGIEENKIEVRNARDEAAQFPPLFFAPPTPDDPSARIEALEALVIQLRADLEALRQGVIP